MRSVITSKYQITIPKEVRDALKLSVHDAVEWRIDYGVSMVYPTQVAFDPPASVAVAQRLC